MILKKPAGVERLRGYIDNSSIPAIFVEAVRAVWPKVQSDIASHRINPKGFYTEIADRIFRSEHPFESEIEAAYAINLGMSIGTAKMLGQVAAPEVASWAVLYPRGDRQKDLCASIYELWERALLNEQRTQPRSYPLLEKPLAMMRLVTGSMPTTAKLEAARLFMDVHYSDPARARDLMFTAGKV